MIICRYSEIGLKGRNRNFFENRLIFNIRDCLIKNNVKYDKILKLRNRISIYTNNKCLCLKNVFGLYSISKAEETDLDLEEIKKTSLKYFNGSPFRITTKRLDKLLMNSQELNIKIGSYIVEKTNAKVDLEKPKTEIFIEIFNNKAYIFNKKIYCLSGLPVSTEGLVTLLLENKYSLLAGFLMLKRGCFLEVIKKRNIPYKVLEKYSYGSKIDIVKVPSKKSNAVIVNDTIKNLKNYNYKIPVLRPLISFDKKWLKYI
ncbi:MAG: THUMP domain-containing protein [archaeon]